MTEYLPIIVPGVGLLIAGALAFGIKLGENMKQKQYYECEKRTRVLSEQSEAYAALRKEITPYTIYKAIKAEIEYDKV